jgi:hypothetical protein
MLFPSLRRFLPSASVTERRSRCPPQEVLGCFLEKTISTYNHLRVCQYDVIIPIGTNVMTITRITNDNVRRSGCCVK